MLGVLDKTAEVVVGNGKLPRVAAVGTILLVAAGFGTIDQRNDPETVYLQDFSTHGECLDGTPFAAKQGRIETTTSGDDTVVTVSALSTEGSTPNQLHFLATHTGLFGTVELVFADKATARYIVAQECPGQPDGY